MFRNDVPQGSNVENISNERNKLQFLVFRLEFKINLVQFVFGTFEQHQFSRMEIGELTDQLRANRASGAGYHQNLVLHFGADGCHIQGDRTASQEIFHPDTADFAGSRFPVDAVSEWGKNLHLHSAFATLLYDRSQG